MQIILNTMKLFRYKLVAEQLIPDYPQLISTTCLTKANDSPLSIRLAPEPLSGRNSGFLPAGPVSSVHIPVRGPNSSEASLRCAIPCRTVTPWENITSALWI